MERVYSKQKETKCIDSMSLRYAKSYDNGSKTLKRSSSDLFQTNMKEFQDCHLANEL